MELLVNRIKKHLKGDLYIWLIVILLFLISLLVVYSAIGTLAYKTKAGNTEYFLVKQAVLSVLGISIMYLAHTVDYRIYSRVAQILWILCIPLLIFTMLGGGTNLNEANRWITLPIINLTMQPSDLAKIALIMLVARQLAQLQNATEWWGKGMLTIFGAIGIIVALIVKDNLSTALILFATCMLLLFIGRMPFKYILGFSGVALVSLIGLVAILSLTGQNRIGTWKNRIEAFSSSEVKEESHQSQQANIAIATGGILGKGPGNSTQRNFLPHPYSDFIFAIIIEEYGLIGALIVLALYLFLLYRTTLIVIDSPKAFGALLAIGLAFALVIQAMVNMAVAVGLFPVTGQTLPLISMGGSSTLFTSAAFGIILSVSRDIQIKREENLAQQNLGIA